MLTAEQEGQQLVKTLCTYAGRLPGIKCRKNIVKYAANKMLLIWKGTIMAQLYLQHETSTIFLFCIAFVLREVDYDGKTTSQDRNEAIANKNKIQEKIEHLQIKHLKTKR
jgi:hypothetical protein